MVIGDRRKFLSAVLCLDEEATARWAQRNGVHGTDLHATPQLQEEIQRAVDGVNSLFARVEHIRRFTILPRALSVEDGELTPTLKVKRKPVNENWADAIEAMYSD